MVNIVSQVIKEYVEKIRPRVEPCGTPDVAWNGKERVPETCTWYCLLFQ
jgi:hypothetical protein